MTNNKPTTEDARNFWKAIKAQAVRNGMKAQAKASKGEEMAEAEAEICQRLALILDRVGA